MLGFLVGSVAGFFAGMAFVLVCVYRKCASGEYERLKAKLLE